MTTAPHPRNGNRARLGIRARITLVFSVLILLLILLFGGLAMARFQAASRSELRQTEALLRENLSRKGRATVKTMALAVESALAENNFTFLRTIVATAVDADPDVSYAAILDTGGKVMAAAPSGARPAVPLIEVDAPIGSGDDRLGTLRLGLNLGSVDEGLAAARARQQAQLRASVPVYAGVTIGFVLLGLASALLISTRITKPLARLTRQAQAIGEGDLDAPVAAAGGDEVGILAATLDGMRVAVKREIADLRTLHDAGKGLGASLAREEVAAAALGALRARVGGEAAALYTMQHRRLRLSGADGDEAVGWPADAPADEPGDFLPRGCQLTPLVAGGRTLGVIGVLGASADARALQFVDTLAGQVAQSLENIRLLEATAEQARIDNELRTAQAVQRALIPEAPPDVPGLEIAATYLPATEVGGDWYGFLPGDEPGELHVLIGDVTGHGVPAALLTACACTTYQMMAGEPELAPAALVARLSRTIRNVGKGELMMTFFAARIDAARREVAFANAGHPAPYHVRAGQPRPARLGVLATGPTWILGSHEERPPRERRAKLAAGDYLVFYTDGLVECESPDREPFGTTALHRLLRDEAGSAAELRDRIMGAALTHYGTRPRADDITLVVARVT